MLLHNRKPNLSPNAADRGTMRSDDKEKTASYPLPAVITHCPRTNQVENTHTRTSDPESWVRWLGFYWKTTKTSLVLGYKFPTWLWGKSFDVELPRSIPSYIRLQNRVLADSPLMLACRLGDVPLIRQHLYDGVGSVTDRDYCTGKTPLMVSLLSHTNRYLAFGYQSLLIDQGSLR